MVELHYWIGWLNAGLAASVLVVAVAAIVVGERLRAWLDRTILAASAALVVGALSGLLLPIVAGPPRDLLHWLYGVLGPIVLLGARYLGRNGSTRRRATFVGVGAIALLGVIYRLFTTA
jgi:hypothetical protein